MSLDNPVGVYRTNCLARINVADKMGTPLAQKELEEFRAAFGRPAHLTLLYHYARLIEMLQCAETAVELLNDPEITSTDIRVPITPRAARGVGCVEAPRGTLIHDYTCDDDGLITKPQPDCRHHPQQRRHQPVGEPGGQGVHQGRQVRPGNPEQGGNGHTRLRPVTELRYSPPGWRCCCRSHHPEPEQRGDRPAQELSQQLAVSG